jgi:hypothetical protein
MFYGVFLILTLTTLHIFLVKIKLSPNYLPLNSVNQRLFAVKLPLNGVSKLDFTYLMVDIRIAQSVLSIASCVLAIRNTHDAIRTTQYEY